MDNDHGITGELREWASYAATDRFRQSMLAIADRIDAEHEAQLNDAFETRNSDENLESDGWVKLPVDADGVPIHVGDVIDERLPFGGYAAPAPVDVMELSRGANGYVWMVRLDAANSAFINPKLLRHHHPPTVEDVLEEFAQMYIACNDKGTIAEYAAKLRLAGDAE